MWLSPKPMIVRAICGLLSLPAPSKVCLQVTFLRRQVKWGSAAELLQRTGVQGTQLPWGNLSLFSLLQAEMRTLIQILVVLPSFIGYR